MTLRSWLHVETKELRGIHVTVGSLCEMNIDECWQQSLEPGNSSLPECLNNATCIDLINSYRCECSVGFTGQLTSALSLSIVNRILTALFIIIINFIWNKTKHKCQGHVGTYRHHSNMHDRAVMAVQ